MCGIAGYLRLAGSPVGLPEAQSGVAAMVQHIAHRGPDGSGVWTDATSHCILGHRRLSVIDTSPAGSQPRVSHNGRWTLTFNGEIYNYRDLAKRLEAGGVTFHSHSDTEVLLEAIAHWGLERTLDRLDGMFAFAVYDQVDRVLHLVRDPFGEKPLAYTRLKSGDIAFASEVDALSLLPGFDAGVDLDAVAEVLTFQYIDAPRTIYRSAEKLAPGSWMSIEASGALSTRRYYRFAPGAGGFDARPMSDLADELEALLVSSIDRRLIADVPLGAFLSGGVDSSTVCALVRRKLDRPLRTFSIGFEGSSESEHLAARRFADHLGCVHAEEMLGSSTSAFLGELGGLMDEPNADSSCLPTYRLAQFARRSVTVAVSGDGGDEMFGGYGRYFATLDDACSQAHGARPEEARLGRTYYSPDRILIGDTALVRSLMGAVPRSFSARLDDLRSRFDAAPGSLLQTMRATDAEHYMPGAVLAKVDRMSMRHALEVRTPFLDRSVAAFAERLPDEVLIRNGSGKRVLREIAYRYLPRDLIDLPKRGFGLPADDWTRTDLLATTRRLVLGDESRLAEVFGRGRLGRFLDRQDETGSFAPYQVWAVAALEAWLRSHKVDLPEAEPERPRSFSGGFVATPLARGLYIVDQANDAASDEDDDRSATGLDQAPPEFMPRLAELISQAPAAKSDRTGDGPSIRLPPWGVPIQSHSKGGLDGLRGATLVFRDFETSLALDLTELDKLSDLGVRTILFRNARSVGEAIELSISAVGWKTTLQAARLFKNRVGAVAVGRIAGWLPNAASMERTDGQADVSRPLAALDPTTETDLAADFHVFEGLRELPPLLASYDDIREKGGGRHAVYQGRLIASAIDAGKRPRLRWLAPRSPASEGVARFRRRVWSAAVGDATGEGDLLAEKPRSPKLGAGASVALFTHGLAPGGGERQWVYLASVLAELDYRVTMIVDNLRGENAHYLPLLKMAAVPVVDLSAIGDRDVLRMSPVFWARLAWLGGEIYERHKVVRLASVLETVKPEVLFSQLDPPNLVAGFAGVVADTPRVVMSFRNYNPSHFPYLDAASYRPFYRRLTASPRVILSGNDRGAIADYAQWLGVAQSSIGWVQNAIDDGMFAPASAGAPEKLKHELDIPSDAKVVLGIFRLAREKDPETFLAVADHVCRVRPGVVFMHVGDGPLQGDVQRKAHTLGLGNRLRFLGRREDVSALMTLADIVLLTSKVEGMPNVVMEAQLCGRPVVSTRAGGVEATLNDGVTGLTAPVSDVKALTDHCLTLLDDHNLRAKMGAAGRTRAETTFGRRAMAQRYLDLAQKGPMSLTSKTIEADRTVDGV
jgi:asparagine synthase (glutamine-hydrolysing)